MLGLSATDRRRWFDAYVRTTVSRDIVELTGARRAAELPRLLRIIWDWGLRAPALPMATVGNRRFRAVVAGPISTYRPPGAPAG